MRRRITLWWCTTSLVIGIGCILCGGVAFANGSEGGQHHTLAGEVEKVGSAAKRITIRGADGAEHVTRTVVHVLKRP